MVLLTLPVELLYDVLDFIADNNDLNALVKRDRHTRKHAWTLATSQELAVSLAPSPENRPLLLGIPSSQTGLALTAG